MSLKIFFGCCLMTLSASICMAEVPANRTNLTTADREAWRKILRWPDELEEQWKRSRVDNKSVQGGITFHGVGQDQYLVVINVHESSYQPGYIFMYYAESSKFHSRASLLKLKTYERDDDNGHISSHLAAEVEGLPTFDSTTKHLVMLTKGRGTGDCGSLVRYRVTAQRAIPVEARVHACYDDYSLGVSDPLRWRKVKRL